MKKNTTNRWKLSGNSICQISTSSNEVEVYSETTYTNHDEAAIWIDVIVNRNPENPNT